MALTRWYSRQSVVASPRGATVPRSSEALAEDNHSRTAERAKQNLPSRSHCVAPQDRAISRGGLDNPWQAGGHHKADPPSSRKKMARIGHDQLLGSKKRFALFSTIRVPVVIRPVSVLRREGPGPQFEGSCSSAVLPADLLQQDHHSATRSRQQPASAIHHRDDWDLTGTKLRWNFQVI